RHDLALGPHGAGDHAGVAAGDEQLGLYTRALLDHFGGAVGHARQGEHRAALAMSLVLFINASRIIWMPGVMRPPRCWPPASTLSTFTAVPASTTHNA